MINRVNKLKLSNFRNHKTFKEEISGDIIAIHGENGSGKTNILEAISLFVPGKGLRGAKLSDLSYFDGEKQHGWNIFIEAEGKQGEVEIGTGLSAFDVTTGDSRIIKIDGQKQRGQNSLSEYLSIFWLTPAEDQDFSSGSTKRRELLDRICGFFFNNYSSLISGFNNLKSQRRNLLLNHNTDTNWVSAIESQMAEKAISIADLRNHAVIKLNNSIREAKNYGFPSGDISILGEIENFLINSPEGNAEKFYQELLAKNRQHDLQSYKTNNGPHRSDLRVIHEDKNMPAELCSQGEQKAMLLSITIAAILAKKSLSGTTPILLLDEVYAHLDKNKRAKLYDFLSGIKCQTWLTGTEKESFDGLENCQFISL